MSSKLHDIVIERHKGKETVETFRTRLQPGLTWLVKGKGRTRVLAREEIEDDDFRNSFGVGEQIVALAGGKGFSKKQGVVRYTESGGIVYINLGTNRPFYFGSAKPAFFDHNDIDLTEEAFNLMIERGQWYRVSVEERVRQGIGISLLINCYDYSSGAVKRPGQETLAVQKWYHLTEADEVIDLGRTPANCDEDIIAADGVIRLSDPAISRRHGNFSLTEDGLQYEDLGSSNGTVLNGGGLGSRIPVTLQHRDTIELGTKYGERFSYMIEVVMQKP